MLLYKIKRAYKIMEKIKVKLFQCLLNQLQNCVYYVLNNCAKNAESIIDFLKKVDSDFNIMIGVINCLLIRKEDIFEQTFKTTNEHPIIYCYQVGWEMVKHYFNQLKDKIIAK